VSARRNKEALRFEPGEVLSDFQRASSQSSGLPSSTFKRDYVVTSGSKSTELPFGRAKRREELIPRYEALPADKIPDSFPTIPRNELLQANKASIPEASTHEVPKPLPHRPIGKPNVLDSQLPTPPPDPLNPPKREDTGPTAMTWSEFIEKEDTKTTWKTEGANPTEEPAASTYPPQLPARPVQQGSAVPPYNQQYAPQYAQQQYVQQVPVAPTHTDEADRKHSKRSRKHSHSEGARGTLEKMEDNLKAVVMDVKAGVKELFGKDVHKEKQLAEHYRQEGDRKEKPRKRGEYYDPQLNTDEVHGH